MSQDLRGAHVLVTRPAHQADGLCRLINEHGGIAVRFPTIEITGVSSAINDFTESPAATNPWPQLSKYQWVIFTSSNAVNFALAAKGGKISEFMGSQRAVIGQATASCLATVGLPVHLMPVSGYDSEALLAMPQLQQVQDRSILIVRGQGGREELADVLRARGARVEYWEVYQRVKPYLDNTEVLALLAQNKINVITITSFETLQNLLTMLGEVYKSKLTLIPLVVISERIKKLAAELGFTSIAVTESPADAAIVKSAMAIINGE
ncbi:MAG: uroporphyrinogen-III synthase [Gammaproteobacteria bacterium]|nr:uroporphyrinogen-III synthase [Gammaproteobacteria bacterium]